MAGTIELFQNRPYFQVVNMLEMYYYINHDMIRSSGAQLE